MADLNLDIINIPTYNVNTLMIVDASTYPTNPPNVQSPTIEVEVPGFGKSIFPFNVEGYKLFNSLSLNISENEIMPLPDGIYKFKYSIAPAFENYVEKSFYRVDKLMEKFDNAFMTLDITVCDDAIKKQSKIELSSIQVLIQSAITAANKCAYIEAKKLYDQANKMLNRFIKSGGCGCSGNNYLINFP